MVTIKPNEIKVSPRQAGPLAMVINELATNTVKCAQPSEGSVAIGFEAESGAEFITLCYRDNGPGYRSATINRERLVTPIFWKIPLSCTFTLPSLRLSL